MNNKNLQKIIELNELVSVPGMECNVPLVNVTALASSLCFGCNGSFSLQSLEASVNEIIENEFSGIKSHHNSCQRKLVAKLFFEETGCGYDADILNWAAGNTAKFTYLMDVYNDHEDCDFLSWSVQHFMKNPSTTIQQFDNWYMGTPEGYDGEYDATYWDDPANVFAPQTLPSWEEFEAAFPKNEDGGDMLVEDIYNLVSGDVLIAKNTYNLNMGCALKLSRAFNYTTKVTIPYIPSTPNSLGTVLGGDSMYYFLNAEAMNRWMRKVFGCANPNTGIGEYYNSNAKHWTDAQLDQHAKNVTDYFNINDVKGIYSAVARKADFGATGHCDLIYSNGVCVRKCYFEQAQHFKWLDIWKLQ